MQQHPENDDEQLEKQRTENDIKKMKLALEHGIDLSGSYTSCDMSPQMEGQFLDYIQAFEDQYAMQKRIPVYDFIGRPVWKPAAGLTANDILVELERLQNIMGENGIVLDTLCNVDNHELYRFITEELFKKETDDIRFPGMMHCYTYEDYYPNHPYDIKNRCTEVITYITDKERDSELAPWGFADNIEYGGVKYSQGDLNIKLINFRNSFSDFVVDNFEYTNIILNESNNEAIAYAEIRYSGIIDGSSDKMDFTGSCSFELTCEYEWWTIHRFNVPGLIL